MPQEDNFEILCHDLIKVLTNDNLPLVQRYMELTSGQPEKIQIKDIIPAGSSETKPDPPLQPHGAIPMNTKFDVPKGSTSGASTELNIGSVIKRAEEPKIIKPKQDLF